MYVCVCACVRVFCVCSAATYVAVVRCRPPAHPPLFCFAFEIPFLPFQVRCSRSLF